MLSELKIHQLSRLNRHYLIGIASILVLTLLAIHPAAAHAEEDGQQPVSAETRRTSRELDRLFGEEMRHASLKLKWHGERLSEDTIYAAALTGASWETSWDKEQMFSLAWGDPRKIATLKKRGGREKEALISNIRLLYEAREYRRVVDTASADFSLDEIGCDVHLKEYVGSSFMALGQPEQAFPIYAAPYEASPSEPKSSARNRMFRAAALDAAMRAGLKKEAVAFSLSLLIEPDLDAARPDEKQIDYLQRVGVDIDRVLLGILQSPEHLRGLPAYYYAASDLVAYRASTRSLPMLLQLAGSSDVYLRSRALIGLGMVAYQSRAADHPGWAQRIVFASPQEYGISSGERKLVDRALRDAAASDRYRLRAAAALAMGLVGDPDYTTLLEKLAKDRAFVLTEESGERSKARRIYYPVRMAAASALDRFGISASPGAEGLLSGKELERAKRGGSDETNDHRNIRRESPGTIEISPIDVATRVREV